MNYRAIIADPPWEFRAGKSTRIKPRYETLDSPSIAALPVQDLAASKSLLFLWTTSSHLQEALHVVDAWGYKYKATIVWVKRGTSGLLQIGMGSYVRNAHEFVLIGSRGGLTFRDRSIPSVFFAPRTSHSTKPSRLHEIVERATMGPYLEMFARSRRPGWDAHGDELEDLPGRVKI
jgi:N6-adenosine-specific RNA methylase IME4